jgi:hypothetical protein
MNLRLEPRADVYELVWRTFGRTLIHHQKFRFRREELENLRCERLRYPIFDGGGYEHFEPEQNSHLKYGFQIPMKGGAIANWGDDRLAVFYMDDLLLCPDCGAFHGGTRRGPSPDGSSGAKDK